MSDVRAWAATRAPELLARAEAEAVALLRDALVAAATAERSERPEQDHEPAPPGGGEGGELLWAYCVVSPDVRAPQGVAGVDPRFPVERIAAGSLAVLVSRVPRAEFGAGALRSNLNDLPWLERVARAHEAVLDNLLPETLLVPLRLCTLYEDEQSVRRMLGRERRALLAALESVAGRQEWGFKLLADPGQILRHAREASDEADSMAAELEGATEAGGYMLRRRLERHLREVADGVADELIVDVRGRLEASRIEFVTRPPQNRDLSQHEGEMLLNAACLVDDAGLQRLHDVAAEIESAHVAAGARVELTGPWPPYNFVLGGDTATLA